MRFAAFPALRLSDFPAEPDTVRSFLSGLSKVSNIGLIETLALDGASLTRANADRRKFTVLRRGAEVQIFESIGPTVSRKWQVDRDDDVENAISAMASYFGEHVPDPGPLDYLYTEHSLFIWRPQVRAHLSRVKRRVFAATDGSAIVQHSRQKDAEGGQLMEFELEGPPGIWRFAYLVAEDDEGRGNVVVVEEQHRVQSVGF